LVLLGAGAEHLVNDMDSHAQWKVSAVAEFINQVTHPQIFFSCLNRLSIPYPDVSFERPSLSEPWLHKQFNSCGGGGVTTDDKGAEGYWQREIKGTPVSALCIASRDEVRVIGMNRQLTEALSEAYPYVYSGAIVNYELEDKYILKTVSYINNLRKEINLLGVFSLDMIATAEQLYVLEINPRIAASFELYEQLNNGLNLVDAHNRVCEGERLPEFALTNSVAAYRIIYAQYNQVVRSGICWPEWVKDRPESGRNIQSLEPICSIHASGPDLHVLTLLDQREKELYSLLNNKLNK
jgi:predicted ATP-grasp superfamily ATP-dependent carboligase